MFACYYWIHLFDNFIWNVVWRIISSTFQIIEFGNGIFYFKLYKFHNCGILYMVASKKKKLDDLSFAEYKLSKAKNQFLENAESDNIFDVIKLFPKITLLFAFSLGIVTDKFLSYKKTVKLYRLISIFLPLFTTCLQKRP